MDVRIRERLVGALVLVALIVLVVPALLKGPGRPAATPAPAESKSVEITLDGAAAPCDSDALVPESRDRPGAGRRRAAVRHTANRGAGASRHTAPGLGRKRQPRHPRWSRPRPGRVLQSAWAVQLGAFSSRSKADGLVAKLRSRGYSAFVLEYRAGGQLLHRVRVGPEQDRARAVAIAERLRKDGYQPVVAPHP